VGHFRLREARPLPMLDDIVLGLECCTAIMEARIARTHARKTCRIV
jgi:hypothetical protein